LSEQLRRLDEKRKAAAPKKKEDAPKQPPGPSSLMPRPVAPQPALLPGAPGPSPITQASNEVQGFRSVGQRLLRKGTVMLNRLHSGPEVSPIERQAFRDEVEQWHLAVKYKMNELQGKGREEAVRELMELLENSVAPKLTQMRVYLGVE
jgi:hypothetical protein